MWQLLEEVLSTEDEKGKEEISKEPERRGFTARRTSILETQRRQGTLYIVLAEAQNVRWDREAIGKEAREARGQSLKNPNFQSEKQ